MISLAQGSPSASKAKGKAKAKAKGKAVAKGKAKSHPKGKAKAKPKGKAKAKAVAVGNTDHDSLSFERYYYKSSGKCGVRQKKPVRTQLFEFGDFSVLK